MRASVESEPGWIFSRRADLALFGGTALFSLALLAAGYPLGLWSRPYPLWAWAATVLFVDVAHVWSTIFRVYLDGSEVRRRPGLYFGAPALVYAAGVALYARFGHGGFWRVLAYVAVWHFVRQQVGWVAIYHRLRAEKSRWDARLDKLAVYAVTVGPVLYWHANLPRGFDWFVAGDFVAGRVSPVAGSVAEWSMFAVLAAWCARKLWRSKAGVAANPGVALIVLSTFACWYGGIVLTNNDWSFTVTNVLIHGVPYLALLWRYARNRFASDRANCAEVGAAPREPGAAARVVAAGAWAFVALLVLIALVEEFAWDQLAWHERAVLFGDLGFRFDPAVLQWIVPLLALPQATHYVLDGFVWRGGNHNPKLASTLGLRVVGDSSVGEAT
jgi:hypothetical protein